MKTLMITTAAALLFAGSAVAGEKVMDLNADGIISPDEYGAAMAEDKSFTMWDADGDGMISADEFHAGNWKMWDSDADGMWSQDELGAWMDASTRAGAEVSK